MHYTSGASNNKCIILLRGGRDPDPLKNHKAGFVINTGSDPLENHEVTKPALNVVIGLPANLDSLSPYQKRQIELDPSNKTFMKMK